ncbi:MAG: TonB-dependent receptor [Candidatus Aminicenantes bacterium]|nr:TonB-dependent receptor [Candidatus Aminicenantes bacterium]
MAGAGRLRYNIVGMTRVRSFRSGGEKPVSSAGRIPAVFILVFVLGATGLAAGSFCPDDKKNAGTLIGYVLDYDSRRGIVDVRVTLVPVDGTAESERSVITDKGGAFVFRDLPEGAYTCRFDREGYFGKIVERIKVAAGVPARLEADLVRLPDPIREEVTVTAEAGRDKVSRTAGAVSIEGERLRQTPGSVDDVSRLVKSMTGLSQVNDLSNELIVRGGSPWENAFYIDQIPFFDINHFQTQGGSGGLIGLINASWVRSLNFYKGGFSASYGDRMSSVIEMAFREGERERLRGQIDLNIAGFGGGIEGPFLHGRGSFLLSVKRSYHDIITNLIGYGVAPRFGDVHFKAVADLGSRHRLEFLNVNADSLMAYDIERAVALGFTRALNYKTRQNTAGLCWYAGWSETYSSVTTLSWSSYRNIDELEDAVSKDALYLIDEKINIASLRHVGTFILGDRIRALFGFETRVEFYDFDNTYGESYNPYGDVLPEFVVRGDMRTTKAAAFTSVDWTPSRPVTISLGARVDHYSHNQSIEASPRLAVSWAIVPRFTIKAAAGIFRQAIPTTILGISAGTRDNRNPYAVHYLLGVSNEPADGLCWTLDVYDKQYRRFPLTPEEPDFPVLDSCVDYGLYRSFTTVTDDGRAYSRGLEFTLEKKPGGAWHGIVGLNLFRSRFRDILGRWRDRLNDNRYVVTMIGGLRLARRWNLGLRWDLAGGVPYTPFDLERSREFNTAVLDTAQPGAARYPDYSFVSLRADREFRFKTSVLLAYVSVLNALNRKNVARYYWDRISNNLGVIYQSPILPVFGLEYRF